MTGKRRLYILCASILPLMICSGLVYSTFSLYMAEVLGAKRTHIGLVYMVGSAAGLASGPFLGKLADRFGRKVVIMTSMAAFTIIFILYSTLRDYLPMYPIQAVEGAAWVAFGAANSAYIADITAPEQRGWAMGVYGQTTSLGWMIGPAFGGFLGDLIGPRPTFLLGAALVAVGFVIALVMVKEPPRQAKAQGQVAATQAQETWERRS